MTLVPKLIALDLPTSPQLRSEIEVAWERGDVVLPLDQRMMPAARRRLALLFGAELLVSTAGREIMRPDAMPMCEPLVAGDAVVVATSGSTGQPKGVIHTHASLNAHADMVGERLGLDSNAHWWLCLPAAHIGGFGVITRSMRFGSTLSFNEHPDSASIQAALRDGATHTAMVPTLVARHPLDGWRVVLVGGAASGPLPDNAISTYGLTETCGGVVYDGVPLSGVEVSLANGEIRLKSPSMARSYRHGPLTVDQGWLVTGDLGRNENGVLRVDGRKDDLIITGGNKVWPYVVEQRLREHPLVQDVVVRGVPDPEWGSIVCAYVVPIGASVAPSLESLRGHVKETLGSYCAPRKVVFVDAIPRNALGKPLLSELAT